MPITGPVPPVRRRTTLAERPGVGRRTAAALGLLAFVLVGGMVLAALIGGAALVLLELLRGSI